jgi:iron complex outermembrane recepter protein
MHHLNDNHRRVCHIVWSFFTILWALMESDALWASTGSSTAIELDDYDLQSNKITYISPTRLKQTPHDIPASVSRITQETIRQLQLNSLPEVFRYIAGMTHVQLVGYAHAAAYHETGLDAPQRVMLLIDGISIYRPFYSLSSWSSLPLTINDIDYIEVTRSPGAASYGINSLMAVINIVTKDPLNSSAVSSNITRGGNDYHRLDLSFSGKPAAALAYRISASASSDDGIDYTLGDSFDSTYTPRDDHKIDLVNSAVNIKINQSTQASLSLYYANSVAEDFSTDPGGEHQFNANEDKIKTKSNYFAGSINHSISAHHDLIFKAYYTTVRQTYNPIFCDFTVFFSEPLAQLSFLNLDYAAALLSSSDPANTVPRTGLPQEDALRDQFIEEQDNYFDALYRRRTCGNEDHNSLEKNISVELEDTYIFSENMRLVSGFGTNRQHLDSIRVFQGEVSSTTYRLFANAETRLKRWVFNTGAMLEYNDEAFNQSALSPRLGANYRLNNDSTLRFVLSKAIQIPDLSERELDSRMYLENLTPSYPTDQRTEGYRAFAGLKARDNLESQELLAREVSLYTNKTYPSDNRIIDIIYDFKVFYNSLNFRPYPWYGTAGNTINTTLNGFETDINILSSELSNEAIDHLELHINYAYLNSDNTGSFLDDAQFLSAEGRVQARDLQFIKHAGSMYSIFDFKDGWFTTLSYSGNLTKASNFSTSEYGFGRRIKLNTGSLTLAGKLSYQNRPDDYAFSDSPNAFFFNARFEL